MNKRIEDIIAETRYVTAEMCEKIHELLTELCKKCHVNASGF